MIFIPPEDIDAEYQVEHQILYPTPLFTAILPNAEEINKNLVEGIYNLKETVPTRQRSNLGGWQSPSYPVVERNGLRYNTSMMSESEIKLLQDGKEIFKDLAEELCTVLKKLTMLPQLHNPMGIDFWANINTPGAINITHTHPNCEMSGAYYVKVPKGDCGSLDFFDPRQAMSFGNQYLMSAYCGDEVNSRYPVEGQMWIFPSSLSHCVGPNKTDEDRISVSFNIVF